MNQDKLKQYVALFGGVLSALLLFLQSIGFSFERFNEVSIDAFVALLVAFVPFILVIYGIYKNTYLISKKAKQQEENLKQKGLK